MPMAQAQAHAYANANLATLNLYQSWSGIEFEIYRLNQLCLMLKQRIHAGRSVLMALFNIESENIILIWGT